MAGVLGALYSSPTDFWLIAACDQPWITIDAVKWLLVQDVPDVAAVMPRDMDRVQPFPGIYRLDFLDIARAAGFDSGGSGVGISSLADDPRVANPRIPDALYRAWNSVNTPEDLALLD